MKKSRSGEELHLLDSQLRHEVLSCHPELLQHLTSIKTVLQSSLHRARSAPPHLRADNQHTLDRFSCSCCVEFFHTILSQWRRFDHANIKSEANIHHSSEDTNKTLKLKLLKLAYRHIQVKMAEEKYNKLNVIDKHMANWKARVIVLIKKPFKESSNNRRIKYERLVLADEWGNCVDAVMYDSDIELYKEIIHQDMAYVISNASIEIANHKYKSVFANTRYSWTINANTMVKNTEYPTRVASPFKGCFYSYNEFAIGSFINAIVVIIKAQPPRPTRTGQVVTEYVGLEHE